MRLGLVNNQRANIFAVNDGAQRLDEVVQWLGSHVVQRDLVGAGRVHSLDLVKGVNIGIREAVVASLNEVANDCLKCAVSDADGAQRVLLSGPCYP